MFRSPSPPQRTSSLARSLAPLGSALWVLFLVWTALTALVWASGFGEAEVRTLAARLAGKASVEFTIDPSTPGGVAAGEPLRDLQRALRWLLGVLDPVWIALAAANGYASLVAAEGIATARRWCGLILGAGFILSAVSAWTGWPLGPIHFTGNLGPRLAGVPLGVPLLWLVIVIGARELMLRLAPRASHGQVAVVVGLVAVNLARILEPVAWRERAWWLWSIAEGPGTRAPLFYSLTWLFGGVLLAFLMREPDVVRSAGPRPTRPWIIILLLVAMLLAAQLGRMLRH